MPAPVTRFVLLRHELPATTGRASHWDLMLEWDGVCWTWAMLELPAAWSGIGQAAEIPACRLPDHRLDYLDYEGPVSGGRGDVARVAVGSCHWLESSHEAIRVELESATFTASLLLSLVAGDTWRLSIDG